MSGVGKTPVVLHVSEAWGGGLMSAVYEYVRSTPDYRHVILARERKEHDTHDASAPADLTRITLPKNTIRAVRAIARAYRSLDPAVVHVHSSRAGAMVRLTPTVPTKRIVYTPHCYAFQRTDLPPGMATATRWAERLLAPRAGYVAACGRHELQLALRLRRRGKGRFAHVPNVARVVARPRPDADVPLRVVGLGRLGPQKDPEFFRAVVAGVNAVDPAITWSWLGGDPTAEESAMRGAGVDVTGWLPREELLDRLAASDVYLHTASWEGVPMSILEAWALGVPVVARTIPPVEAMGVALGGTTPGVLAQQILELRDANARKVASEASLHLAAANAPATQVESLNAVYNAVSGFAPITPGTAALSRGDVA